jgi:hypothetical protein
MLLKYKNNFGLLDRKKIKNPSSTSCLVVVLEDNTHSRFSWKNFSMVFGF